MNREIPAPAQLRSAARLIERALQQLDMTHTQCGECASVHYNNREHAKLYEQVCNTPSKLMRVANVLEGKLEDSL